jgi:hypothetical protein
MGFFLTSSAENAVPAISGADSKTHGPLSRVKDRAADFTRRPWEGGRQGMDSVRRGDQVSMHLC